MTLHNGQAYSDEMVAIERPDPDLMRQALVAAGIELSDEDWLVRAGNDAGIYYFAITEAGRVVGQILLHDLDRANGETLIAYHIFQAVDRGRSTGSRALKLLQKFVTESLDLKRLIIITSRDNLPSQRTAEKCGFQYIGASREDPLNGMVFEWRI